jgi:hypothetical protein
VSPVVGSSDGFCFEKDRDVGAEYDYYCVFHDDGYARNNPDRVMQLFDAFVEKTEQSRCITSHSSYKVLLTFSYHNVREKEDLV